MEPQSNNPNPGKAPIAPPLSLKELAEVLIRHYELHEGLYEVGVQFNIAVGTVGPTPDAAAPGVVFTVEGLGLSRASQDSPLCVDAAIVNRIKAAPAKKPLKTKATKPSLART